MEITINIQHTADLILLEDMEISKKLELALELAEFLRKKDEKESIKIELDHRINEVLELPYRFL